MTREKVLELIEKYVSKNNLKKHMYATEAVMKSIAEKLGEDSELWALTGLVHDLDYDETVNDFQNHGFRTAEILSVEDVPEEAIHAIKAHPGHVPIESTLDRALFAVDPITGLIVAATLMHPSKKLKEVDVGFLKRRFKDKRFAAGADRDQIKSCEKLGIPLDEFMQISLKAMQSIDTELGL
ncbi:MAG: HDIG domain-containing protein [bacterium]